MSVFVRLSCDQIFFLLFPTGKRCFVRRSENSSVSSTCGPHFWMFLPLRQDEAAFFAASIHWESQVDRILETRQQQQEVCMHSRKYSTVQLLYCSRQWSTCVCTVEYTIYGRVCCWVFLISSFFYILAGEGLGSFHTLFQARFFSHFFQTGFFSHFV